MEANYLDVQTIFLNGEIDQERYMSQPEGFVRPGTENKVCLLKKATYGLKLSLRLWYEKAHRILLKIRYEESIILEPCIFEGFRLLYCCCSALCR